MQRSELEIRIEHPDGRVQAFNLHPDGTLWVGRGLECHVLLSSPQVSRRHASIDVHPNGLLISDVSDRGTYVNGELLRRESRLLACPANLRIGSHVVRLFLAPAWLEASR